MGVVRYFTKKTAQMNVNIIYKPNRKLDFKVLLEKKKEISTKYDDKIRNSKNIFEKSKFLIQKQIDFLKLSPFANLYLKKMKKNEIKWKKTKS